MPLRDDAAPATAQQPPPASPPLPTPHTAVTPGPRATRFQQVYASSLAHTLAKISWDNFAACYPTMAASGGAAATLRKVQKQMVDRLEELCNVSLHSSVCFVCARVCRSWSWTWWARGGACWQYRPSEGGKRSRTAEVRSFRPG